MRTLYYTSPDNFRGLIDGAEKVGPLVVPVTAGAIAGLIASPTGLGLAAGLAVTTAAGATCAAVFNSEGTDGFKQHMLTSDDEGRETEIVIKENNMVEFRSNSGTSTTGYASKRVKKGQT